jgi:CHAT domain-containing protein
MSSGSRTLLLSRWRTGGQTSFDAVREFAQELPHVSPAEALRRALLLAADSRIDLEAEPRVKRSRTVDPPKASHPFFWSGYMLVDSGVLPEVDEAEMEEPVIKFKAPKKRELQKAKEPQPAERDER